MSYESLLNDIKKVDLKKVYLCYGNEEYLKDWIIKELKKNFVDPAFETLNYVHYDGKDIGVEDIINASETLPFMSDKKIVIIEDSPLLSSGKGGSADEEERLNDYFSNLNDSTCLIFIVKGDKIDKRKKLVKGIKKNGAIIELNKISSKELNSWVEKIFKKNKKKISRNNVYYFIQSTGYLDSNSEKNLYDLENEITKLSSYVGNREEITKDDIDKNLAKTLQNNIFNLLDAIGKKKTDIALTLLNEMILDNEPIQKITYMIIRQFRLLFMAKLYWEKGYGPKDITKKLGVHPYATQKVMEQGKHFSSSELEKIIKKCLDIDSSVKTGKIDNKLAIENLIVEVAR